MQNVEKINRLSEASILVGDLSDVQQLNFALIPILQKLHNEGDTGRLQVRPRQGSYGTIYFEQGEIVHAAHATLKGVDAFVTIVTWNLALHSFRPNVLAKDYTIDLPFSELLTVLARGEAPKQSSATNSSSVGAEATTTPQTNRPTTGAAGTPIPKSFLSELTRLFVDVKGPIADIIMEDISYDLGYDLTDLPSSELKAFYKGLLKEIPTPEAQRGFVAALKALEAKY